MSSEQPKEYPKTDTPDPYRHCNHEDYCHTYQMRRMNDIPEGWACPYPCEHDARSHPVTALKFHQPCSKVEYTVEQIAEIDKQIRQARKAREDVLKEACAQCPMQDETPDTCENCLIHKVCTPEQPKERP